jgi:hypothetical protein
MRRRRLQELREQVERLAETSAALAVRVDALEDAVREDRMLSVRIADVVDVVTELLVPAAHRRDDDVAEALRRLQATAKPRGAEEGAADPERQERSR